MECLNFGWSAFFCVLGRITVKVECALIQLLRRFVRDVVNCDQLRVDFSEKIVQIGAFDSEEWEPVLLTFVEILLKPVSFIVIRSAGADLITIQKKIFTRLKTEVGIYAQ